MNRTFQQRHANQIVGIFVLLTLGVLVAAVALGPHTQRWLTPARRFTIRLPREGSLGLRKGADVLILGSVVGSVDDISVNDDAQMEAEVSIRGNFGRFVRADSKAFIRKPLGIGDASIEITRGTGAALPPSGGSIQSFADEAPTQMLEDTLEEIRSQAVPALKELRQAVQEYTALAADLRAQQPGLSQAIGRVNRIAGQIDEGNGVAGELVSDPRLAQQARDSLTKLNAVLDDTREVAADLHRFAADLPKLQSPAQRSLDQLPALMAQIDETFRQMQRLTEALQRNWMVRGDMAPTPTQQTIRPDQLGQSR
jgi:ABC-type transporter Mla subunit MlaD